MSFVGNESSFDFRIICSKVNKQKNETKEKRLYKKSSSLSECQRRERERERERRVLRNVGRPTKTIVAQ
jgi:hypothetical protein